MRELEPDLIVTQALCHVCAVAVDEVQALAQTLPGPPRVISLDPTTYGETLGDIRTIAQATDSKDAALDLIARTARRADVIRLAVRGAPRPRIAALEWLDPVFVAGHWTPQLVEMAGGEDVLGFAGEPSRVVTWEEVAAAQPEIVVVMPCGYDAARALVEAEEFADRLRALGADHVVAVNASAYFSRPGPAARRRPRAPRPHHASRPRAGGPRRGARGGALAAARAAHRPLPALVRRALRRRPPARPARGRTGPASATGRSSCSRWTASCARTSRRRASRCSSARSRCCGARR